jgi:C1A family cysteine protease
MGRTLEFCAPRIPSKVDYSRQTAPPGNQGNTGSCVGWASAYGLRRWMYKKTTGRRMDFSVRFVWMGAKEYDPFDLNVPFDESGTRIRDAFKLMRNFGACPDRFWRFASPLPRVNQEDVIKQQALRYRIGSYHRLNNNTDSRVHLAKVGPFVAGVPVYSNWSTIDRDGLVPDPGGQFRGGHAILIVGYDDKKQLFKFQNSWGRSWGDRGYGYITYEWMKKYSWDCWGADLV